MARPGDPSLHGGARPQPIHRARFRSLASRLVALGIGQMVLLAVTAAIVFIAEGPHEPADPEDRLTAAVVGRLERLVDQPAALTAALDELLAQRIEVALYDEARQLIASNVDPPLAIPPRPLHPHRPPPDDRAGAPRFDDERAPAERRIRSRTRLVMAFHPLGAGGAHGARGVLVARGVHGGPPGLTGPLLVLGGGFLILVIGALITARWIVRPIERLSRTARALGSGDLQARSRLDRTDEIGELGHRFDEMAERITSLLVTEKELLANVAHELRTPLTRIGVALDLANEGDSEAARASLVEIAVDVSELETIVDDILTAMRFELAPGKIPAQLPLRRAIVPASEIAAAAADRLRARHPERPLEVTASDADIHVDPVLFRRVIDNLLENAHKYTPDTSSPIELVVTRADDRVVFEVRDRGVGISSEDLPRIFTAFFRSERSRSRETGGVGLGLTLARRLVEAHDGAIDVTSTIHVGTQIRVTIPAAPTAI
jgi:two-component system, OmpR family, sensor kinase